MAEGVATRRRSHPALRSEPLRRRRPRSPAPPSTRPSPRRSRASTCSSTSPPTTRKANALTAIERGVAVVIGTSGLTADDFAEIDAAARDAGVGVIAPGNFSLTAAMAQAAALLAARHLPVVGGHRLRERGQARRAERHRARARRAARPGARAESSAVEDTRGRAGGARGRRSAGRRSTRCGCRASPCRPRSCSGCPTSGSRSATTRAASAAPYVAGTLLAARAAPGRTGPHARVGHAAFAGLTVRSGVERARLNLPPLVPRGSRRAAVARQAVKDFLHANGSEPRALADVLLAVSEVVTNSVVHGYGPLSRGGLRLLGSPNAVRLWAALLVCFQSSWQAGIRTCGVSRSTSLWSNPSPNKQSPPLA